jgi:short-subunit dehydrogenase involved in D-alanine esterification of teichoic acids
LVVTVSSGLAWAPLKVTPSCNSFKAAIHMLTDSIRRQLADTTVDLVGTRTVIGGHRAPSRPFRKRRRRAAGRFRSEVIEISETEPDVTEIQGERVKFLRYGEVRGDYHEVVATINASDPTGT